MLTHSLVAHSTALIHVSQECDILACANHMWDCPPIPPIPLQVLMSNLVALAWNVYMSYKAHH